MEIFDAFCGLGPWAERDPLTPYRTEDVLELLRHFGVVRALAYPSITAERGEERAANRMVARECEGHPELVPAFALAKHPYEGDSSPDDYLEAMADAGAKAAWLWPQGTAGLAPWMVGDIIRALRARRIPMFVHAERVDAEVLDRLCGEFPDLRIVLVGAPYLADKWLYPLLRAHRNLHVCLGHYYVPAGGPMRFVRHFGADRLLFGSGLPQFSPGGLIAHMAYAEIQDTDRQKILSGNLERLLEEAEL
jgi:hypothetical protein